MSYFYSYKCIMLAKKGIGYFTSDYNIFCIKFFYPDNIYLFY